MRIVITGAMGFIGSWITKELVRQGYEVYALDDMSGGTYKNLDEISNEKNFHMSCFGCEDEERIGELFETFRPDVVYHLAANAREGASFFQPLSIVKRNTLAYTNVLMNSIKYGAKRVILFSSIAVYGEQIPPFHEDIELDPVDMYGLQKKNMEDMTNMMSFCHNFEYVIFRPFNVYGPYQALNDPFRNLFGIVFNKIMRGENLQIYGKGDQERAFTYIEDCLPTFVRAMDYYYENGRKVRDTFNIGSDKPYSVKEAVFIALERMGKDPETYPIDYLPERYGEVESAYCNIEKSKKYLQFRPITKLQDGLEKMAIWAKQQGPQEWVTGDPIELPDSNKLPRNWLQK